MALFSAAHFAKNVFQLSHNCAICRVFYVSEEVGVGCGGVVRHKSADGSFGDTLAMAFFLYGKRAESLSASLEGKKL